MADHDNDRRVRRTKAQLRQALTELLCEKEARSITVRELADRADVNRGTFYAHYRDIFDMLKQVEDDFFAQLQQLLDGCPPEQLREDLTPMLEQVFQFVKDNRDLLPTFLDRQATDRFFQRLNGVIYQQCLGSWTGLYPLGDMSAPNYWLEFVVAGMVGMVRTWAQKGFRESPKEMAALAGQLIQSGLNSL